jgi:hypothetical protein
MDRYTESEDLSQYEFRVQGVLDDSWADWFDGMTIRHQQRAGTQSETILTGSVVDQVALHGILAKIRDLNLKLISFRKMEDNDDRSIRIGA